MGTHTLGTATFTAGSTAVTGSGTNWTADMIGATIIRAGLTGVVASVTPPSTLTLAQAAPAGMAGTGDYAILLNTSDAATAASVREAVATLLAQLLAVQGAPMAALIASSSYSRGLLDNPDGATWRADLGLGGAFMRYDAAQTLSNTEIAQVFANLQMTSTDAEWAALVDASLRENIRAAAKLLPSGVDLNTITQSGFYELPNPVTNGTIDAPYAMMLAIGRSQKMQLLVDHDSSKLWVRGGWSSGWGPWLNPIAESHADARYGLVSAYNVWTSLQEFRPAAGQGGLHLVGGNAANAGYVGFISPDGTRQGYIGFGNITAGSPVLIRGEGGRTFDFWPAPTVSGAVMHHDGRVNRFLSFTVATVPSASTSGSGATIYVSNESGGAVLAFSDGTNWRRVTDRAVIS